MDDNKSNFSVSILSWWKWPQGFDAIDESTFIVGESDLAKLQL